MLHMWGQSSRCYKNLSFLSSLYFSYPQPTFKASNKPAHQPASSPSRGHELLFHRLIMFTKAIPIKFYIHFVLHKTFLFSFSSCTSLLFILFKSPIVSCTQHLQHNGHYLCFNDQKVYINVHSAEMK
jgi:hypothetical protein